MNTISRLAAAAACCIAPLCAQAQFKSTLIEESQMWGTAIADYNGDGKLDIYITGHDKNDRIWYWTPEGYQPSAQVLQWSDRHDCDAADVNLDGRMDFYCAVGATMGTGSAPNELWMQQLDGTHKKAVGHGAEDIFGRSRMVKFFDFNHDGYPDIFLTNLPQERDDGQPNINHVYLNQKNSTFVETPTVATGMFGSVCIARGDIDKDGWDDLLLCAESYAGPNHLYLNNRSGNFTDLALPPTAPWVDAKLADVNRDGWDDLIVLEEGRRVRVWLNKRAAPYYQGAPNYEDEYLTADAMSVVVVDFDRNGSKDVFVVLRNADCRANGFVDAARDVLYKSLPGGGVRKEFMPMPDLPGCGYKADVLGSKILLLQGGGDWVGPAYVLEWATGTE